MLMALNFGAVPMQFICNSKSNNMKRNYILAIFTALGSSLLAFPTPEPIVKQNTIERTSVNLRTPDAVVLSQLIFNAPEAGKIALRFDGYCVSDSGDLIVVAASNTSGWSPDDGNVGVEASHPTNKRRAFSHTRVYNVAAGLDTFYAVAQNYVDTKGSGIASVYGHFTLEYFPQSGAAKLIHNDIDFSGDIRTVQKVVQKVFSPDITDGKVFLHIDGQVSSDFGDQIMLSASNVPSWLVGDGSVAVKALSTSQRLSPYSHSRVYNAASSDTFYAVTRNVVGQAGSGNASIYGNLSAQYFPTSGLAKVSVREIEKDDMNVRGAPVAFDSITITAATDGYVLAQLDGYCTSQLGDRILFAVSNNRSWGANSNCVSMSAAYSTNKFNTIAHSRLFPIPAGTHTFYSVSQNYGDLDGDGLVDVLANFTVKFFPEITVGVNEITNNTSFMVYPNPATDILNVVLPQSFENQSIYITDITGRLLQQVETHDAQNLQINIASFPKGMLFIQSNGFTQKVIKH